MTNNDHPRSLRYLLLLLRALSRSQAGDAIMQEIIDKYGDKDTKEDEFKNAN